MAELDYNYIGELVLQAREGDSDAFAELYAATYRKQYMFACSYLKDAFLAQDALQETYVSALRNLHQLNDPTLFVAWLNQINFRICYNMSVKQSMLNSEMERYQDPRIENISNPENRLMLQVDEREYLLQQVLSLPFSESQAIFLHYYKGIKIDQIAYMMEISKSSVKRYLASGKKHLAGLLSV